MKVTKYGHACFSLEESGRRVIIDPGSFTDLLGPIDSVDAVVVTHNHLDHWSQGHLEDITRANPDALVFTTAEVAGELTDIPNVTVLEKESDLNGGEITVGSFGLRFYVGLHAEIHSSVPRIDNVGVLVNDGFYYAGDSFAQPDRKVDTLAVPISAPWLKISEVMDYIDAMKVVRTIPTHDILLSDIGFNVSGNWVRVASERAGSEMLRLTPGDDIHI